MPSTRAAALVLGLLSTLLPRIAGTTHAPLSRDPQDYLVLGMRSTRVFSLAMEPPGCNIGVNCVPTVPGGRKCGFFHAKGGQFPSPSQVVANQVCGTASFHQVFANLPTCADPTCAAIADPGSSPDCTEPFAGPIVGDLDGDNAPSCDGDCSTDPDDIARLCGTTLPFPACDPSSPVLVEEDSDCSLGDTMPGNMRCDLGPGTYGAVRVRKGARIVFGAGTTVVCSLNVRTAARVTTDGQATVLLPGKGAARFGNSVDAAGDCGRLRIVSEAGFFRLGRFGDFTIDACTIRGTMKLGHGNNLRGHIVGDVVASDISNDGRCCPRIVVSTTTTTPTTSTTATTTTSTSVTSTTEPPPTTTTTSSTTTTTDPGATTTTTFSTITTTTVSTTTTTTTEPPTTTSITVITTTTSQPPTTTTTTTTQPTTTTTTQPPMTTTTAITSTTTTTTPGGGQFTRTPGFWKNHPAIVQQTLSAGALDVCGHAITDVDVNHGHSALEGMCVTVGGDQRVQLVRQLIAAALNMAAGGATFGDFTACNALCQDPGASVMDLASCIDSTDAYNNSGDAEAAPFDPPGRADPRPCQRAHSTACTVLSPAACAAP